MKRKCEGKKQYPHLFSPLRIGNIKMKNRIICAPTSPSMIDLNGHFTPEMIAYLEEKAKASLHVPVAVISDDDFENMRGEEVLKQAIELLG